MSTWAVAAILIFCGLARAEAPSSPSPDEPITLRVFGLPNPNAPSIAGKIAKAHLAEFRKRYPYIRVERATGLAIEGKGGDIIPLLQIAGNIAPDVLYVNFRQSDTYIRQEFLYPLDEYVAELSPKELAVVPQNVWPVIRRKGPPDGKEHVYAWPTQAVVAALFYRRDTFQKAGLPDRPPETWTELMDFARKLTDPDTGRYGLYLARGDSMSYNWVTYLWSAGGDAVTQDAQGEWRCVFDSDAAATAALFWAKLQMQPWRKEYVQDGKVVEKTVVGVVQTDTDYNARRVDWEAGRIGMRTGYLYFDELSQIQNPDLIGIGPVPKGPTGIRGSEINCLMMGVYNGVSDPRRRRAAWDYISFWMSPEARRIRVEVMVKNGYGRFVQPALLEEYGYPEYLRMIPPSWRETFDEAVRNGRPEPYGKNCQQVYVYMSRPLGQILDDATVKSALANGDDDRAFKRIKAILHEGVEYANEKMIGIVPAAEQRFRKRVALAVAVVIAVIFLLVFVYIWRIFSPPADDFGLRRGRWQFAKYRVAYLCLIPAVGSILLWQYYPLFRGAMMAFQDYRVTGKSAWVGLANFAEVLFDGSFWFALFVAMKYAAIALVLGFPAPILLAILLQEIPRGRIVYRTLYYLPAVITGVVVIFLWKSFYRPDGLFNQIVGLFGLAKINWLQDSRFVLLCCVLPTVWAQMGPGCLIYLAALKTIPDELYEAANIDGAGLVQKIRHVTLPSLKTLILINFVGAFIGAFQSSSFILAMTGGGPYNPNGQSEVLGLKIFYTAYFYLRFGVATAMAWLLGLLLIGFTVMQLKRLRNIEFRAAGVRA